VRIGEGGDPPTDAEAARLNVIDNNFIHDGGKVFRGGVGVWIGRSSYNTVSHNEVCDFDYSGMSVGWSWGYAPTSAHHNVLEYNHIHNIGRGVLNDMGAIYTLGISPGTVERYNLMHDIYCWVFGGWGVYTDEGSSDILIENNVVYNTSSGCFHQHYGKENLLRNNVFAFGREGVLRRSREEEHTSFLLEHNLVLAKGTPFLIVGWSNGHYQIDHNLYWDLAEPEPDFFGMDFADWQAEGRDPHSLIADPLCVDAEHYDFRLRPGSPAEKIGFMPIDLSKVGLYGDPEWVNAPQKVQRQPYVPPPPQPPPPPEPIAEGFEGTPVGEKAVGATTYEEGEVARIRVTDETGAASKYSLKFVDAPGLQYRFNPHLFYATNFTKGVLEENLDLRIEPGAIMYHEWRDSSNPYRVGPAFSVTEDGRLLARDRELARVPAGEWMHLTITCALGKEATGTFNLTVTLPGQEPRQFENLPCHPKFKQLRWFGFVADGDKSAVFYLDNLLLEPRAE
jgi:hypothetical protein